MFSEWAEQFLSDERSFNASFVGGIVVHKQEGAAFAAQVFDAYPFLGGGSQQQAGFG
jgi:hypothetical protein